MSGNNTNIVLVETIENYAMVMASKIKELDATDPEQKKAKYDAQDYLNIYQVNQIKALRDAFE